MRPIPLQVFKCMKCSTQFSQDTEYVMLAAKSMTGLYYDEAILFKMIMKIMLLGSKQLKCPICDSSLVIEIENPSGLDNQTVKNQSAENSARINLQHSESFSSIGELYDYKRACSIFYKNDFMKMCTDCIILFIILKFV